LKFVFFGTTAFFGDHFLAYFFVIVTGLATRGSTAFFTYLTVLLTLTDLVALTTLVAFVSTGTVTSTVPSGQTDAGVTFVSSDFTIESSGTIPSGQVSSGFGTHLSGLLAAGLEITFLTTVFYF